MHSGHIYKVFSTRPQKASSSVLILKSELFDGDGKLAVSKMLDVREKHQSGTSVRSERILAVDTKFDKARANTKASEDTDSDDIIKLSNLSVEEGSHRVRVAQDMARDDDKPKKIRQMRWQNVASELTHVIPAKDKCSCIFQLDIKLSISSDIPNLAGQNINSIFRLQRENFVMMSTERRFYVGEVLDIYKQAASSRYGSVDDAATASSLSYLALRVYLPLQVQSVSKIRFLTRLNF